MAPQRKWSDLPTDVLILLSTQLLFVDNIRFAAVCRSWHAAASRTIHHISLRHPWLFIPLDPTTHVYMLYSPIESKPHRLLLPDTPRTARCCGASFGWVVTSDRTLDANHLVNPFTSEQIPLPPCSSLPVPPHKLITNRWMCSKAILSSRPRRSNPDCIVVYIHSHMTLSYCRIGDVSWSPFPAKPEHDSFEDAIFKGKELYALNDDMGILVFQFDPNPTIKVLFRPSLMVQIRSLDNKYTPYLVESRGEMLMLIRRWKLFEVDIQKELEKLDGDVDEDGMLDINGWQNQTTGFDLIKMNKEGTEWHGVTSFGDEMIFVGTSSSRSVTAVDCPTGLNKGCIYYTDDRANRIPFERIRPFFFDVGGFCLEDKSVWQYHPDGARQSKRAPLWFMLDT